MTTSMINFATVINNHTYNKRLLRYLFKDSTLLNMFHFCNVFGTKTEWKLTRTSTIQHNNDNNIEQMTGLGLHIDVFTRVGLRLY